MESPEIDESFATLDESPTELPIESSTVKDQDKEDKDVVDTPQTGDKEEPTAAEYLKEDVPEPAPQETGTMAVELSGRSTGPGPSAKAFLGKGKIDAKAQDDFIAFMLGKK